MAEVEAIFDRVKKLFPRYLPNFALRAYVGLRTTEASKMKWDWIDFERKRIVIPAEICKTRDAWVLQAPVLPDKVFRVLADVRKECGPIPAPYKDIREQLRKELPKNRPASKGDSFYKNRQLDCEVMNALHYLTEKAYDVFSAPFLEGNPIYDKGFFLKETHVQICVKDPSAIVGYFLPSSIHELGLEGF